MVDMARLAVHAQTVEDRLGPWGVRANISGGLEWHGRGDLAEYQER